MYGTKKPKKKKQNCPKQNENNSNDKKDEQESEDIVKESQRLFNQNKINTDNNNHSEILETTMNDKIKSQKYETQEMKENDNDDNKKITKQQALQQQKSYENSHSIKNTIEDEGSAIATLHPDYITDSEDSMGGGGDGHTKGKSNSPMMDDPLSKMANDYYEQQKQNKNKNKKNNNNESNNHKNNENQGIGNIESIENTYCPIEVNKHSKIYFIFLLCFDLLVCFCVCVCVFFVHVSCDVVVCVKQAKGYFLKNGI